MKYDAQERNKRILIVLTAIALLLVMAIIWFAMNTGEYVPGSGAKFVWMEGMRL